MPHMLSDVAWCSAERAYGYQRGPSRKKACEILCLTMIEISMLGMEFKVLKQPFPEHRCPWILHAAKLWSLIKRIHTQQQHLLRFIFGELTIADSRTLYRERQWLLLLLTPISFPRSGVTRHVQSRVHKVRFSGTDSTTLSGEVNFRLIVLTIYLPISRLASDSRAIRAPGM